MKQRAIIVYGLRRSGNHAIINWIRKQIESEVVFYNDVDWRAPRGEDRFVSITSPKNVNSCCSGTEIISIEDQSLYDVNMVLEAAGIENYVSVMVHRDPYNMLASRLKHIEVSAEKTTYITGLKPAELWIMYSMEFAGITNIIRGQKLFISYNRWTNNLRYRQDIANYLDIPFTDTGYEEVTAFGSGSSFDQSKFSGRATSMNTSDRWLEMRDSTNFINLFNNTSIHYYAENIFDLSPSLKSFSNSLKENNNSYIQKWYSDLKIKTLPKLINKIKRSKLASRAYDWHKNDHRSKN